jgi:hypothetical protein
MIVIYQIDMLTLKPKNTQIHVLNLFQKYAKINSKIRKNLFQKYAKN